MNAKEQAVRDAASNLSAAIADAVAAGYRVDWPADAQSLGAIAISETARVNTVAPGAEYEAMTKSALAELATARGIEVKSDWNKSDYITALRSQPGG